MHLEALPDKHLVIAATSKGRLINYSAKNTIRLQYSKNVSESSEHQLVKTSTNDLYLQNASGLFKITLSS
jgi:hypothetical protein